MSKIVINILMPILFVNFVLAREGGNSVDIRGVGNGGGLAEMRVIYLFQNVDRFLKICLTVENACRISEETRIEWQNITRPTSPPPKSFEITFVNDVPAQTGFLLDGQILKISNKRLYADLNTPKKFNELLAYVVTVEQELLGTKFSFQQNLEIANQSFKNLVMEEQNHKVIGVSSLLRLAQLKVFDGLMNHVLISLEDEDKTINLTEGIRKSLPCGLLTDWELNQFSSSIESGNLYFYGFANGNCAQGSTRKRIVIKASLNDKMRLREDQISVHFFEL